jgi:diguanylate cyclase (GGDEF)-like protein
MVEMDELSQQSTEISLLMRLAETLNRTNPPERALESGLRLLAEQVDALAGWFLSLNQSGEVDLIAIYRPDLLHPILPSGQRVFGMCACLHRMLVDRQAMPQAQLVECERLSGLSHSDRHPRHHLSIPIQPGGKPVGMINLVLQPGREISPGEFKLLEVMGDQFGGALERARLFVETQRALERERRVNRAAGAIAGAFDAATIYQALLSYTVELACGSGGAICMRAEGNSHLVHVANHHFPIDLDSFGKSIPGGQSVCWQVIQSGRPMAIDSDGLSGYVLTEMKEAGVQQILLAPIPMDGTVEGVLAIASTGEHAVFDPRDFMVIQTLAEQAGVVLKKVRLYEEVKRLATVDSLTGLASRAHFIESAETEFRRSLRYRRSLSVMMIDIDHFKGINDSHGHAIGDQALQAVAAGCRSALRQTDLIGRMGGEEIAVLMPETTVRAAVQVAERLRSTIENIQVITPNGKAMLTTSVGVASKNRQEKIDFYDLLSRADEALYRAKKEGRNRVVVWKNGQKQ